MIIDEIIRIQQPDIHKQLSNMPRKIQEKENKNKNKPYKSYEKISFKSIEKIMREKADVDERKCR